MCCSIIVLHTVYIDNFAVPEVDVHIRSVERMEMGLGLRPEVRESWLERRERRPSFIHLY